jgi:hypothetical protein
MLISESGEHRREGIRPVVLRIAKGIDSAPPSKAWPSSNEFTSNANDSQ